MAASKAAWTAPSSVGWVPPDSHACHEYTVLASSLVWGTIRIPTGDSRLSIVTSSCSAMVLCWSIMSCFLSLYRLFGLFNRLDSLLTCLSFLSDLCLLLLDTLHKPIAHVECSIQGERCKRMNNTKLSLPHWVKCTKYDSGHATNQPFHRRTKIYKRNNILVHPEHIGYSA